MGKLASRKGRSVTPRVLICQFAGLLVCPFLLAACHPHQAPPPSATSARPAVRGADRGLEIWTWAVSDPRRQPAAPAGNPGDDPSAPSPRSIVISDDGTDIESLLSPYLPRPVPMP